MSYDFRLEINTGGSKPLTFGHLNHTYNCAPMFKEALGKGLYKFNGWSAEKFLDVINKGIEDMVKRPEYYSKWNPSNGWGSYQTALDFLAEIGKLCRKHPKAFVNIT